MATLTAVERLPMSRPVMIAIARVALSHPHLAAPERILEFAEHVEAELAAILASGGNPRAVEDEDKGTALPHFLQDATDALLAGMVDDLLHLRQLVQIGPPFDRAEFAAHLHTLGANGDTCWKYMHTYLEASTCAGTA